MSVISFSSTMQQFSDFIGRQPLKKVSVVLFTHTPIKSRVNLGSTTCSDNQSLLTSTVTGHRSLWGVLIKSWLTKTESDPSKMKFEWGVREIKISLFSNFLFRSNLRTLIGVVEKLKKIKNKTYNFSTIYRVVICNGSRITNTLRVNKDPFKKSNFFW